MTETEPRIEYIEARRVLLDALTALQPHIGAIVLIGAQAVYLRTAGRLSTYQPFTTDADLAFDPALLADIPLLGDAMLSAGFELTAEPGIWQQRFQRPGFDGDITNRALTQMRVGSQRSTTACDARLAPQRGGCDGRTTRTICLSERTP